MMVDSSKFNKTMPFTFGDLSDFEILISDDGIPEAVKKRAQEVNVTLL